MGMVALMPRLLRCAAQRVVGSEVTLPGMVPENVGEFVQATQHSQAPIQPRRQSTPAIGPYGDYFMTPSVAAVLGGEVREGRP